MFKKILVPVDGSEGSWRALNSAVEIGEKFGSELEVVNVNQTTIKNAYQFVTISHLHEGDQHRRTVFRRTP